MITAHWITETVSVTSGVSPSLLFDYGGFPPESYKYEYPAPGSPMLASRVSELLSTCEIPVNLDESRKWDHGVFVPMMLMYPAANIPVVSLSLQAPLDPQLHIRIGRALAPLRNEGVLLIGSGMTFHNFDYFFTRDSKKREIGIRHSHIWNDYLLETLKSGNISREEQLTRLGSWSTCPSAIEANPLGREEHLIPLLVVLGAADEEDECSLLGPLC